MTLSQPVKRAVVVTVTVPGFVTPRVVRFAAGQTAKTIDVAITGDRVPELNQQLTARLLSATNATVSKALGRILILDDDRLAQ